MKKIDHAQHACSSTSKFSNSSENSRSRKRAMLHSSDQTPKRKRCSHFDCESEISKLVSDNQNLLFQINQLQERLDYLVTVVEEVTEQQVIQVNRNFAGRHAFLLNIIHIHIQHYRRTPISKLLNRWRLFWKHTNKAWIRIVKRYNFKMISIHKITRHDFIW